MTCSIKTFEKRASNAGRRRIRKMCIDLKFILFHSQLDLTISNKHSLFAASAI